MTLSPPFFDDEPMSSQPSDPLPDLTESEVEALTLNLQLAAAAGDEARCAELLRQGAHPGDYSEGAFCEALEAGHSGCATLICEFAGARGVDLEIGEALRALAEIGDWDTARALMRFAHKEELYRAAYGAQYEDHELSEYQFLIDEARLRERSEWSEASSQGLFRRWSDRPLGAYEALVAEIGAPVWACAAAEPASELPGGGSEPIARPESRPHEGRALGLSEETLLVDSLFFESWEAELRREAPERLDEFLDFKAEWRRCESALPRLLGAFEKADKTPEAASKFAKMAQTLSIARMAPFFLVWGEHAPFDQRRAEKLLPVVDACQIDKTNAGFFCANLGYGSFNARVARMLMVCHAQGRLDDDATALIDARFSDLLSAPAVADRLIGGGPFASEIKEAANYFKVHAEALCIQEAALPGSAPARGRPRV